MSKTIQLPTVYVIQPNFDYVFETPNLHVEVYASGRIVVHKGTVEQPNISAKTEFAKALKTGDVITDGPNKGWIYCEARSRKAFLVAAKDSGLMTWHEAAAFATSQNAGLPSRAQLRAMYQARHEGALIGTFSRSTAHCQRGWYWSANEFDHLDAWCHNFPYGGQGITSKNDKSSVRLVRPLHPA